ncbi:sugar ABC transporter permease [Thermomicrobiaceae bacterium CFH 74404]|uniref:Sugar ABC transporter permease n=1 Tax=Thermalbibacter longus TaxID=2951981 RepID=A0AA42B9W6_9BACT|nr:sugar ABC transporter permease [Thermalbibacter longus]MCM8748937.1 sugar ABC transporter permease [Thermalbibacter longus]
MDHAGRGPAVRALPGRRGATKGRSRASEVAADYAYILPALAVLVFVVGYPIVYTLVLSFYETPPSLPGRFWTGLGNYRTILTSAEFFDVTLNTVYWALPSTILAFALGIPAALALNQGLPGQGILRGLLLIPWVISTVTAAYVWRWLYHADFGLVNGFLMQLGLISRPILFLDSPTLVIPALIVVNVWKTFPFVMVMTLAGLQTVPRELLEAAAIDGATAVRRFWHVTVPYLRNVLFVTFILLLISNLEHFTIPWLMTGGGPARASQIWSIDIYTIAFRSLQFGLASAYSTIVFAIVLVFAYLYVRALTKEDTVR